VQGNAVATVAGNPITLTAFNHWMYVAAAGNAAQSPGAPIIVPNDPPRFANCIAEVRKQVPSLAKTSDKQIRTECSSLFTSLSTQVMDFLIRAYWYQAEALDQKVAVTDQQVQKAFQTDKQQAYPTQTAFQAFLKQSGQTLPDILFRVRVNLIYQKLISKHVTKVTPAEISSYYNSHLSQFGTPESRDLRIVLTKTFAQAKAAETALKHGDSWKLVAKKYSTDPTTKNTGGLLTGITKGQEDAALDQAAFSAPRNVLLGPVKGQFGYYVFEVTKITKATQQSLAQATALIQQTLTGQAQNNAQSAVDAKARKDWQHRTTCRAQYSMNDCSGYKAPKGSTGTPTG
jgi:foldase protein PrsA